MVFNTKSVIPIFFKLYLPRISLCLACNLLKLIRSADVKVAESKLIVDLKQDSIASKLIYLLSYIWSLRFA